VPGHLHPHSYPFPLLQWAKLYVSQAVRDFVVDVTTGCTT
jgi:hypothetical protein